MRRLEEPAVLVSVGSGRNILLENRNPDPYLDFKWNSKNLLKHLIF